MSGAEDDGLLLNLALPEPADLQHSRTQQRKQNWRLQRAIKKHTHIVHHGGGRGGGLPGWLGGGSPAQQQAMPAGGGQLKGYSLDAPAPAPAAAPPPRQEWQQPAQQQALPQRQHRRQPEQQHLLAQPLRRQQAQQQQHWTHQEQQQPPPPEQQQNGGSAFVFGDCQTRHQSARQPTQWLVQQQQSAPQQAPSRLQQQQQQQHRGMAQAKEHSGARLAADHKQRQQQRHRGRGSSPQPGRRGGAGKEEDDEGEETYSKHIGKLRLASRKAGYREATPDLDEVKAAGSDAVPEDVTAAVVSALARDKVLQRELAAAHRHRQRLVRHAASDFEDEGGAGRGGMVVAAKARGKGRGRGPTQKLDRFACSSSEEEGEGRGGVVDFGGNYSTEQVQQRRQNKKRRKEREAAAAVAAAGGQQAAAGTASKRRGTGASVRPGDLVHAGGEMTGAAQTQLFADGFGGGGFEALGLSRQLADHLVAQNFSQPTRVQQQAIPVFLSRRDALINAPTGSGKTLSYLAPIVHDLAAQLPPITRAQGTFAIVVCPTRELCLQVADVLTMLVRRFIWLVGGAIHGGEDRGKEKARLRRGVTVLVATPGRLLDHLQNTQAFRTEDLRWLVLDEADRLLDLGFEKKVAEVCSLLDARSAEADYAARRTTALLSATLHSNLGKLASLSLKDPAAIGFTYDLVDGSMLVACSPQQKVATATVPQPQQNGNASTWAAAASAAAGGDAPAAAVAGTGGGPTTGRGRVLEQFEIPAQLRQRFVEVPCKLRLVALGALLRARLAAAPASCKMVVFLSTTDAVEYYHAVFTDAWEPATGECLLQLSGAPILKLHGGMPQAERTAAFLRFTKCAAGVLLCTDVAARGLDFPAVTDIVQFDPPGEAAEYVHRVGRTARLGHKGDAVLFLLPSERSYVTHLAAHGVQLQEQPAVPLLNHVLGQDRKAGKDLPLERHQGAYMLQKQVMEAIAGDHHLALLGSDAFRSWVRAYATHAAGVKDIFHVRRLHLGHVAHAFALKERPSLVGKSSTKQASQQKRKAVHASHAQQQGRQTLKRQQVGSGRKVGRQHQQQVVSSGGMYTLA